MTRQRRPRPAVPPRPRGDLTRACVEDIAQAVRTTWPTKSAHNRWRRGRGTRYPIRHAGVRQLLVTYLERRQPELGYSTLDNLARHLASHFWSTIETLTPGQADPRLDSELYRRWREQVALRADGTPGAASSSQSCAPCGPSTPVNVTGSRRVRVFAQALTTNFASELTLEDYNLADSIPCWKEACLGTIAEKMVKFADPVRRQAMKAVHEERGGLFGAGYDLTDIKIHWISSDVPDARALKDEYEGFTIGEVAVREGKHEIDAFLDVAVAGQLRVGFATPTLMTPVDSMREIATGSVSLPGVSDGGAHTKFVTTARYPTEMLGLWVREHNIMSLEDAHWRLSYFPALAAGLRGRGHLTVGAPADVVVYDPDTINSLPAERVWDYPAGEWRLIQKAVGYDRIIVNGQTTFIDGECTQATPGRFLRHGTD